jgi:hypothetical protein
MINNRLTKMLNSDILSLKFNLKTTIKPLNLYFKLNINTCFSNKKDY